MNHWKKAFTLVELMVVIGITGIPAGLLFPALCKAKAQSRSAACISNLRQIGFALSMYVGDFHRYPSYGHWTAIALPQYANQQLIPYAGNSRKMFLCPAHCPRTTASPASPFFTPLSYGYNGLGTAHWLRPDFDLGLGFVASRPIMEAHVKVPSDMIEAGDVGTDAAWDLLLNPNGLNERSFADGQTTANSWLPSSRHRGGANILYCDGHSEHADLKHWIENTDHARRRWNSDHEPHPETWQRP